MDILEKYYKSGQFSEGRKKMAKMPLEASLIYNPSSGAPGFYVKNVFCLPGVPAILESMLPNLTNKIVGGEPILSKTISLRTLESEIAKPLKKVQEKNNEVDIGSYPFFRKGKIGVSIVLTSKDQSKIEIKKYNLDLNSREIMKNEKKLKLTEREIDIILYLNENKKPQNIEALQKKVWGHVSDLETHTVETHVYRLRKKIKDIFSDDNFIISLDSGYKINE